MNERKSGMNRSTLLILLVLTLAITACGGSPNTVEPVSGPQGGPAAGELSAPMQLAIGTIKLDETENAVTPEQASELLPLWQTLQVLYASDTSADQEMDALITQLQETMTVEQTQAITTLNLTRQDMMSIMQEQGTMMGGAQNGNSPGAGTSSNGGQTVRPGGGGFAGGPPPDGGGFPAGGPDFQGGRPQSSDSTTADGQPAAVDPNRIPTPLVQAVIEYLKDRASQT